VAIGVLEAVVVGAGAGVAGGALVWTAVALVSVVDDEATSARLPQPVAIRRLERNTADVRFKRDMLHLRRANFIIGR